MLWPKFWPGLTGSTAGTTAVASVIMRIAFQLGSWLPVFFSRVLTASSDLSTWPGTTDLAGMGERP